MIYHLYKKTLLIWLLCIGVSLSGQGIHFTYLDFAPQHVNPANLGGFLGSYRGAAIYRDQFNNSGVGGYKDFEIGIDMPVMKGFRKQDWIGAGISINNDVRGTIKLTDRYSRLGVSYHLGLDAKQTRVFTVGLQVISLNRSLSTLFSGPVTPEGLMKGQDADLKTLFSQGVDQNGNKTLTARDYNLGIQLSTNNARSSMKIGASVSGLLPSTLGFSVSADSASVPFKMVGYLQMINQMTPTVSIEPTAIFQITEYGGREFMLNAKLGYKMNKAKNDKIKAGVGFRTGTLAAVFLLGAELKGINFGLSYDMPISGYAAAPGIQNGFEFGASYIGVFTKRPKPTPIILCPRL
jgi:type IX secretion system PorP/SprF family membrane protein